MRRRLYLHVGCHRTATTSIQQFMVRNFDTFLAHGYLVPYRVGRHFDAINKLSDGALTVQHLAKDLNRRADSKPYDIHSLLMSDEDICTHKSIDFLSGLNDHFNVTVLMSVRRQDLWLESWYLQNIKWQWNPKFAHIGFSEFLKNAGAFHWLNYFNLYDRFAKKFGTNAIRVTVFERDQLPNGPIVEFARNIDLQNWQEFWHPEITNHSMSGETAEVLRHLPLDEISEPMRQLVQSIFEHLDRQHSNGKRPSLFTPETRADIVRTFQKSNSVLAKKAFDRDDLFSPIYMDQMPHKQHMTLPNSDDVLGKFFAPFIKELFTKKNLNRLSKLQ